VLRHLFFPHGQPPLQIVDIELTGFELTDDPLEVGADGVPAA
jgi:hypothetical protein